jgi:serine protease Do
MEGERITTPIAGAAALEHLTGPSHGKVMWLSASTVDIYMTPRRFIHVAESRSGEPSENLIARLHSAGETYEIEVPEDRSVWVNGVRIHSKRLEKGDMIEFGDAGPLSRFCLYGEDTPIRQTIVDILNDSIAYLRVSRQPKIRRVYRAAGGLLRRLSRETTTLFRVTVVIAIVALTALTYQQSQLNLLLEKRLESSTARLDSFAAAIARAGKQALRPSDLEKLRQELGRRLTSDAERLAALEKRSQASARVIAGSMPSVVFIQGGYGFREKTSQRMLRHVVDDAGGPMMSPLGQPMLSLDGGGPVAERQFTGTGFAVGGKSVLISNRHVALPWENDAGAEALTGQGLAPVMIKLIVYRPGKSEALAVALLRASEDADLAILKFTDETAAIPGLKLAAAPPAAGDEVIVMGYPTGLRSMLAQSGAAFIEELQKAKDTGFWSVAARLAQKGHIAPLASRGIVGQATAATIVYDAETTHGGSGGPVLDANGAVIAVNTAILPEFGGSNLGVPAAKVRELLEQAGLL